MAKFYQSKKILWPKPTHSEKYLMEELFYHMLWYLSRICFYIDNIYLVNYVLSFFFFIKVKVLYPFLVR
jgi:hypothetical protein